MNIAIEFKNVSKKFQKGQKLYLKQALLDLFRPDKKEDFWAIKNVSFKIKKGESIGIIGANGSGKSTILKLIAGVLTPTKGTVEVMGRIGPLIELGAGFHPELSGRDNIYLNGTILGLSKEEIDRKFNDVVSFAELEDFIDTPVKHYSSGMQLRLGFSIAVSIDPEILIIDEVLSVGDVSFQQKSLNIMREFRKRGVTIILVTHDHQSIQEFCDRALFIKDNQIVYDGKPEAVVYNYLKYLSDKERNIENNTKKLAGKIIDITKIEILDRSGKKNKVFKTKDTVIIRINFKTKESVENPVFGIAIYKDNDIHISGPNTKTSQFAIEKIDGIGYLDYQINKIPLLAGKYYISVGIFNSTISQAFDFAEKNTYFQILPLEENQYGIIRFSEKWSLKN